MTMKFLIDTNFLLIPGKFKVDIFSEMQKFGKPELYTLDQVVRELEKLASGKGSDSKAAKLALDFLDMKDVTVLKAGTGPTDREIEKAAMDGGFAVCTQDKALIKRLKKTGVKVVFLRQKRFLEEG